MTLPHIVRAVATYGKFVYAATTNRLFVIDTTSPSEPQVVGELATGSHPTDIVISDGQLYLADYRGVSVFSLSDPLNPEFSGETELFESCDDDEWLDEWCESRVHGEDGVYADPWEEETCTLLPHRIDVYQGVVAVSADEAVVVVSAADPQSLVPVSNINVGVPVMSLRLYGTHLYTSGPFGARVVNVRNPLAPELVAENMSAPVEAWARGREMAGNYMAGSCDGFVVFAPVEQAEGQAPPASGGETVCQDVSGDSDIDSDTDGDGDTDGDTDSDSDSDSDTDSDSDSDSDGDTDTNPPVNPCAVDEALEPGSSGVCWKRCPLGQTWSGSACTGAATMYTQVDAINACQALATSSSNWRLATTRDFARILGNATVGTETGPSFTGTACTNSSTGCYAMFDSATRGATGIWTQSVASSSNGGKANLSTGVVSSVARTGTNPALCLRDMDAAAACQAAASSLVYSFENGEPATTLYGSPSCWSVGAPTADTSAPSTAQSGSQLLGCPRTTVYSNSLSYTTNWAEGPRTSIWEGFKIAACSGQNVSVHFYMWTDIEPNPSWCTDGVWWEISTDGGYTWTAVPTSVPFTDSHGNWCMLNTGWLEHTYTLPASYLNDQFRMRWVFYSDAQNRFRGPFVDNVHLVLSQCNINGTLYADGAANPANGCQRCDTATSATSWTSNADGSTCSGGLCHSGTCSSNECFINGTWHADGSPTTGCTYCSASSSRTAWTNRASGYDGGCGTSSCAMDTCVGNVFYDYPASCQKTCNGSGACEASCGCTETQTACTAGGCCAAACTTTQSPNCYTTAGACADVCGGTTNTTGRACNGCGGEGATGTCAGGTSVTCSSGNNCASMSCGGATYYCNAATSTWQTTMPGTCCAADEAQEPNGTVCWKRCPLGQTWSGSACTGAATTYTQANAISACQALASSSSNWRLATTRDFARILGNATVNNETGPSFTGTACTNSSTGCYAMFDSTTRGATGIWSQSVSSSTNGAKANLSTGAVSSVARTGTNPALCLRDMDAAAACQSAASAFVYSFENGEPATTLYGSPSCWSVGAPTANASAPSTAQSGSQLLGCPRTTVYSNSLSYTTNWAEGPRTSVWEGFKISQCSGQNVSVHFYMWTDIEPNAAGCPDGVWWEISTDGGYTWTAVPTSVPFTDAYGNWCLLNSGWLEHTYTLPASYLNDQFRMRWVFYSNAQNRFRGPFVDNVHLVKN
ncbi:MAG: hypothetical protein PHU25_17645 [Deltaproteobacteria bacterium]|nr:hypothetical protein [Deltaproteobacteria bacterium]